MIQNNVHNICDENDFTVLNMTYLIIEKKTQVINTNPSSTSMLETSVIKQEILLNNV